MRKFLAFFIPVISLLIFSCAPSARFAGKVPPKDDLTSLRKHLAYHKFLFFPLSSTETIVSYYTWGDNMYYYDKLEKSLKWLLRGYCEAQGGKFDVNSCIGGKDPFKARFVQGIEKPYSTMHGSQSIWFAYIKTTKPDIDIDYGFYDTEFIKKAKSMDLDTFVNEELGGILLKPQKIGNKYQMQINLFQPHPPYYTGSSLGKFWKVIEYCKAYNGELVKKRGDVYQPFRSWMKSFLLNKGGAVYIRSRFQMFTEFPLSGKYICTSKTNPFRMVLRGLSVSSDIDAAKYYVEIKELNSLPEISLEGKQIEYKNYNATPVVVGNNSFEDKLALDVVAIKSKVIRRNGPKVYTGIYAFPKGGCDYVVVLHRIPRIEKTNIDTYKICNGKISEKKPTQIVEPLPDFIKPKLEEVVEQAKIRGFAMYEDNYGYLVVAKALRQTDLCNLDVFVLHKGETIYYNTINACR